MSSLINLQDRILNINSDNFLELALEVFDFQSKNCAVYSEYLSFLRKQDVKPTRLEEIPYLPTEIFKTRIIKSGDWNAQKIFESSGTTQLVKSKLPVKSMDWYHQVSKFCFEYHYGSINDYQFVGLLPSPQERPNSSLVSMVQFFTNHSKSMTQETSYMNDYRSLNDFIGHLQSGNKKIILFGLSFALLDFVKSYKLDATNLIVIETGGMKSSNRELDKETLLRALQIGFPNAAIHSEYGMTELMSQAYAEDGINYTSAPLLKFQISDPTDPTEILTNGKRGIINIIDLGNIYNCSFLQTGDLGILDETQRLNVLGRFNTEELRGCVQMFE